jgi:hypothetical protein
MILHVPALLYLYAQFIPHLPSSWSRLHFQTCFYEILWIANSFDLCMQKATFEAEPRSATGKPMYRGCKVTPLSPITDKWIDHLAYYPSYRKAWGFLHTYIHGKWWTLVWENVEATLSSDAATRLMKNIWRTSKENCRMVVKFLNKRKYGPKRFKDFIVKARRFHI